MFDDLTSKSGSFLKEHPRLLSALTAALLYVSSVGVAAAGGSGSYVGP